MPGEIGSPVSRRPMLTFPLALGVRKGACCVGCSWALMAALFALGVMSLTWMGLIAALVLVEKLGPWSRAARSLSAGVLLALALGFATHPNDVPGLIVPGSSSTNQSMRAMK